MVRRSRRRGNLPSVSLVPEELRQSRSGLYPQRYKVPGRILTLKTYLPRPVAYKVRREIYPYPFPKQRQKFGRSIRLSLRPSRAPMVLTKVRIRLPSTLPVVRGSMVSLSRGRLNIHSYKQVRSAIDAKEFNRRRYSEYKRNRRKASHGQLDSRGSERFGAVAEAFRRGNSIDAIGDAALAVRAIVSSKRR